MVLVAVRRQTLRQEVTRILCRYIVDTPLHDGDPLPGQRDLAEFLQVSRTVVREALSSLEAKGIIAIRPGANVVVRNAAAAADDATPDATDVGDQADIPTPDLFEFRTVLYMGLPELICDRATADDIRGMRELLATMDAKLSEGRTILGEVQELIWQLAAASHNQLVIGLQALQHEADRRGLLIQSSILGKPTKLARQHFANHVEMVDAVEARDPDRLRRVFREEFVLPLADGRLS
jgi:DNA-binding FadR family transcriptional regulator